MMGELTFYLGLQTKQVKNGLFIHQSKYRIELLKKLSMDSSKESTRPMTTLHVTLDVNE